MPVGAFSVVALPDTQYYSERDPAIFEAQTRWIAENAASQRIAFVVHLGDITNRNSPTEWTRADRAISTLDGVVPYSPLPGNHDMGEGGSAASRDTSLFRRTFPSARFSAHPWFGGTYDGGLENAYYFFSAEDFDFLVLCLEFGPRDEVLRWANEVVSAHPGRKTIVVTHTYLGSDDALVRNGDAYSPSTYACGGSDGETVWTELVRRHPNIFLVLSGHVLGDGVGRLSSVGADGNTVHQLASNYQMLPRGGEGWLRVLRLGVARRTLDVLTYSPLLRRLDHRNANEFSLPLELASSISTTAETGSK